MDAKMNKEIQKKRKISPTIKEEEVKRRKLNPTVKLHKLKEVTLETTKLLKSKLKKEGSTDQKDGPLEIKEEVTLKTTSTKLLKSQLKKEGSTDQKDGPLEIKEEVTLKTTSTKLLKRQLKKEGSTDQKDGLGVKKSKSKDDNVLQLGGQLYEIISTQINEAYSAVVNVVELLDSDHTVPFIARYRKEKTKNMEVKQIREVQYLLTELRMVQTKASNIYKQIENQGKMSTDIEKSIQRARSIDDLDHIYTPFKTASKSSLAERAKKAGLEPAATRAINNVPLNLHEFISSSVEGCGTIEKIMQGVQHILADVIAKDKDTMDFIRQLTSNGRTLITGEKSKSAVKEEKETNKTNHQFKTYFNFKSCVRDLKPHQMLALNRGDAVKELSVKLELSSHVGPTFKNWCQKHWIPKEARPDANKLFTSAIDDAYKRLIQPLLVRQIRSELTRSAEKASVDVFAQNLKRLLLTPPVRGKVIVGLDPGFKNGCKVAIISETGAILHTDVLYLHHKRDYYQQNKLVDMVHHYKSDLIAIGNGTACRETEKIVADLISEKWFSPLNVMYCIVNEDGASIYSVSEEAEKEMPDLDPNVRSAVSIARRLQDPLVELVKNNPKNIGVGMYQHDMPEKLMKTALDGVVEDCVSFVGIDLNVCSESLLRRIAGLSAARAKKIIEFREKNGRFVNRQQLLKIKGLGKKSYEQCAGFVRISGPINSTSSSQGLGELSEKVPEKKNIRKTKLKTQKPLESNLLDKTWIHPESYNTATKFLDKIGEEAESIGLPKMRNTINKALETSSLITFSNELNVGVPTMQLIIDGLKQPLGYDIRAEYDKPLFKIGIMSVDDLRSGSVYPGRITNFTHFGCFVDIGVNQNGLIHTSKMQPHVLRGRQLGPGDKVEVMVLSVDKEGHRIQLQLVKLP